MLDKLVDLFIQFLSFFQCIDIVMGYQNGLRFRLGKVGRYGCSQEPLKPGFYAVLPFYIDEIKKCDVTWDTMMTTQSFTSADGKPYIISTVVTFNIGDVVKFWLSVDDAPAAVSDTAEGEIATYLRGKSWATVYMEPMNADLTKLIRKQALDFGLQVKRVRVTNLVLEPYNVRIFGKEQSSLQSLLMEE